MSFSSASYLVGGTVDSLLNERKRMNYGMPPTWMLVAINSLAWVMAAIWFKLASKQEEGCDPIVIIISCYICAGTLIMGGNVLLFK